MSTSEEVNSRGKGKLVHIDSNQLVSIQMKVNDFTLLLPSTIVPTWGKEIISDALAKLSEKELSDVSAERYKFKKANDELRVLCNKGVKLNEKIEQATQELLEEATKEEEKSREQLERIGKKIEEVNKLNEQYLLNYEEFKKKEEALDMNQEEFIRHYFGAKAREAFLEHRAQDPAWNAKKQKTGMARDEHEK